MTEDPATSRDFLRSHGFGKRHPFLRILAVPGALIILLLNLIGRIVGWLSHGLDRLPLVQYAELWVRSLSPGEALYVLCGILCLLAPLELGMIWALASCHFSLFLGLEIVSKIVTPLLLVRAWSAAEAQILQIAWCRIWYARGVALYEGSLALLHGLPGYLALTKLVGRAERRIFILTRYMALAFQPAAVKILSRGWENFRHFWVWSGMMKVWPLPEKEADAAVVAIETRPWRFSRVALYAIFWTLASGLIMCAGISYFADRMFEKRFSSVQDTMTARGVDFAFADNSSCNWIIPCRIFTGVRLTAPVGPIRFSAARIKLQWLWWLDRMIVHADGPILFDLGTSNAGLEHWQADKLHIRVDVADPRAQTHDDTMLRFALHASGLDFSAGPMLFQAAFSLSGPAIDPLSIPAWEDWRKAGGIMTIDRLAFSDRQNAKDASRTPEIGFDGTASLDREERIEGAFTLSAQNLAPLVPKLEALSNGAPDSVVQNVKLALHILAAARTEDNRNDIHLPMSIEDGNAYIGPIKLFRVGSLFVLPATGDQADPASSPTHP